MDRYSAATPADLGALIRRLRKERGLSQLSLCEAAGVSHPFLVRLEQGHSRAELGKVFDVVRALNAAVTLTKVDANDIQPKGRNQLLDGLFGGLDE